VLSETKIRYPQI
jgi:ribonuclease HI